MANADCRLAPHLARDNTNNAPSPKTITATTMIKQWQLMRDATPGITVYSAVT